MPARPAAGASTGPLLAPERCHNQGAGLHHTSGHGAAHAQVQTVDQCQGDEADAVVLTLVLAYTLPAGTAPPGTLQRGRMDVAWQLSSRDADDVQPTDYVQFRNRANVAISRARYHLTVIASESVQWRMQSELGKEESLWGKLLDAVVGGGVDARPVFDGGCGASPFNAGRPLHAEQVCADHSRAPLGSSPGRGCCCCFSVAQHCVAALRRSLGVEHGCFIGADVVQVTRAKPQMLLHREGCDDASAVHPGDTVVLFDAADVLDRAVALAFAALLLLVFHAGLAHHLFPSNVAVYNEAAAGPRRGNDGVEEWRAGQGPRLRAELGHVLGALLPSCSEAECGAVLVLDLFSAPVPPFPSWRRC